MIPDPDREMAGLFFKERGDIAGSLQALYNFQGQVERPHSKGASSSRL